MKKAIKSTITAFAVFSTFLMLSSVFVQPVSAQVSKQLDIKYVSDVIVKIVNDKEIVSLAERFTKNSELKEIISKIRSATTKKELVKYANKIPKLKPYQQMENLLYMEYGQEMTVIERFVGELKKKPNSIRVLQMQLQEPSGYQVSMGVSEAAGVTKNGFSSAGSHVFNGQANDVSESFKSNNKNSHMDKCMGSSVNTQKHGTQPKNDNGLLFLFRVIISPIVLICFLLWALVNPYLTLLNGFELWLNWLINGVAP